MSEDSNSGAAESLKFYQKKNEEQVAPLQREKLNKLTVKPIEEILGDDLYKHAQEQFLHPTKYSSFRIGQIANRLKDFDEDNIREVKDDGQTLLVKDYNATENLSVTEIFLIRDKDTQKSNCLYRNYLITDRSTGLTADILDLAGEKTKTKASHWFRDNAAYLSIGQRIYLSSHSTQDSTVNRETLFAHEAGHSHQFPNIRARLIDTFSKISLHYIHKLPSQNDIASQIVRERNAWAFALTAARRYRELGVDLTELIKPQQANEALSTYNRGHVEKYGLKFSKVVSRESIPQGVFKRVLIPQHNITGRIR